MGARPSQSPVCVSGRASRWWGRGRPATRGDERPEHVSQRNEDGSLLERKGQTPGLASCVTLCAYMNSLGSDLLSWRMGTSWDLPVQIG